MDLKNSLIQILEQLLKDMQVVQQQGAGYYTCSPVAKRYNKLLGQARTLFPDGSGLVSTFEDLVEEDPKDPGDKMKVMQAIRIEINQLLSLLRSAPEGESS